MLLVGTLTPGAACARAFRCSVFFCMIHRRSSTAEAHWLVPMTDP
jgi:hypothetical protein